MKSPLLQFIIGSVFGGLIACTITLHLVTKQVEANTAREAGSVSIVEKNAADREAILSQTIDAWQKRAQSCEGKFAVGTVVYERQELASIPLMHGAARIGIGLGDAKASLYIPAQVDIYSDRPDVRYQWFDGRTGASQGVQVARSPSEAK
jgi:hypothetical protein